MGNVTNLGKDSNNNWVPMGAVQLADGRYAAVVAAEITGSIFGNRPHTLNLPLAGTAADANAGTIVMETTDDVSMYNRHEFSIVVAPTTGSVEVLVSHDGVNYEATPIEVIDRSLKYGAAIQSVSQISTAGNYYFEGAFKLWKLQNNAATTVPVQMRGASMVK